ncbi:MJ0042 family finger-like domain-containing protein [Cohaesibacter marisflavi]|uniref:MJ0042 family finger-like domain-containing protein n=1 Tax=Cohaesibacter marisflavi TaxID=655353 RepID=A0A1I5IM20_9HYPH|nr:zinc-ribbon domain-containing protein [Cohaesibacter marisflavi]SFO61502.1 MJ0042 family finger-like domain-containing protein [Cohaesibacter marisflavi]
MKITCPNCATSYQVPDDYIGAEGRSVRCSSCGETWHAEQTPEPKPEKAPDPKPAPKPAAKEPEAQPAEGKEQSQDDIDALFDSPSGGGEEQSQDDIDALFDSPSGGEEQSQDDIDALFDSPSGGEEQSQDDIDALFDSPSGGEEQSQDDIDALFDSPSGGEEQSQDDIDALFDSPSGGEEQSQDDIDSLFDEPAGKAEKAEKPKKPQKAEALPAGESEDGADDAAADDEDSKPFVVKGDGGDDFQPPVVDLLDAAAFEAQKKVARGGTEARARSRRRKARAKKQKGGAGASRSVKKEWVMGSAALAATVILLGALFMAPQFWVKRIPDLASLYSMFGMDVNVVGVDIEMVDVRLEQKSGSPVLAIETELVNPGTEPVILPSVEFSVLGKERLELYSWTIGPDHVGLGPGERKLIETSIAAPAQARYLSMRVFNE